MKTNALTLLLGAAVTISACQTGRQAPPPSPQPDPGTGTTAPQPNPNPAPEPPVPPVPTPGAGVARDASRAPAVAALPAPAASSAPAAVPAPAAPLASVVPDQPAVAVAAPAPAAPARPHKEILKLKEQGLSDEAILQKVRTDNVPYRLTTTDVVELRAAGLPERIVEAMLRSGQPPSR